MSLHSDTLRADNATALVHIRGRGESIKFLKKKLKEFEGLKLSEFLTYLQDAETSFG